MLNLNDYLASTATITLTMEELHTIASALQEAYYSFNDEAKKLNSEYYAEKASKCWALFEKSNEWFPDYIDEKDR